MLEKDSEVEIGDYFRANLLAVRKAINEEDFKKFAALKTDGDRVAFVLGVPEARLLPLDVSAACGRNVVKAVKFKEQGNAFFAHGDYIKAMESYSNAAVLAPNSELGIILANRSASLHRQEYHELALSDVEEALRVGYPKELVYKVEERRARCLLALKKHGAAVEAFRSALKALDHAKVNGERKQKIESDIRVMLAVMEKGRQLNGGKGFDEEKLPSKKRFGGKTLPRVAGSRNPEYPSFSDAVEIRDLGGPVGRHAVATREILPGEVLALESPHCAVLLAEFRLSHCHHCFSRMVAPIPASCNSCSCVAYCGTKCRDMDAKVHLTECILIPVLWISCASVTCLLALRAVSQKPLEELIKLKEELKIAAEKKEASRIIPYNGDDYKTMHSLVTHEEERTSEDLFHRAYMAAWLLRLLKKSSYFPQESNSPDAAVARLSPDEIFVGGLLLHNLQLLQFNAHEISEMTRPKGETKLEKANNVFIGGGLYPTVALLNHSCNPGVIRYFSGTTIIIRALRTIRTGEEISENYGPIFTTMPKNERKRKLRLQYWFDCGCEACTEHWPLLEDIDPKILRFRCDSGPDCGNILPVSTDSNEFMVPCPKCKKRMNILKGLKAIQDTDAIFKTTSRYLEEAEHEKALKGYLDILKLLGENLALPIRDYHLCQQGVRLCLLTLGNTGFI